MDSTMGIDPKQNCFKIKSVYSNINVYVTVNVNYQREPVICKCSARNWLGLKELGMSLLIFMPKLLLDVDWTNLLTYF